jgi:hypothetical protein
MTWARSLVVVRHACMHEQYIILFYPHIVLWHIFLNQTKTRMQTYAWLSWYTTGEPNPRGYIVAKAGHDCGFFPNALSTKPFWFAVGAGDEMSRPVARTYAVAPAASGFTTFCSRLHWLPRAFAKSPCPGVVSNGSWISYARGLCWVLSLFFIDPSKQLSAAAFRPASEPNPWPPPPPGSAGIACRYWLRRIQCCQCRRPHANKWRVLRYSQLVAIAYS